MFAVFFFQGVRKLGEIQKKFKTSFMLNAKYALVSRP